MGRAILDTSKLKAEDAVVLVFSSGTNTRRQRATVKRVTPTGIVTVVTGSETYRFERDGRRFGSAKYHAVVVWLEEV